MTGYLRQLRRSIAFIESRLGEDLDTRGIARRAGMSSWHFQRIFGAAVGQPLMTYVRQRRLSRAMEELRKPGRSILDIALDCGFGSQEAFTRAFKDRCGITPGAFRKRPRSGSVPQAIAELTDEALFHLHHRITMKPRIDTLPPRFVAGLERPFISALSPRRNNHLVIPQLWHDFGPRISSIPHPKGTPMIGCITCDDPETGSCRYLACLETDPAASLPPDLVRREIPGGKHAIFVHRGPMTDFGRTIGYVYGSWLPRSGHRLRKAPEIEIYGDRFIAGGAESEMEFCLPIQ